MRFKLLKRGAALMLSFAMAACLAPGEGVRAADGEEAAAALEEVEDGLLGYRKPFLSGSVRTWVTQGEKFDRNDSRNMVFADDQEDGDLTDKIESTGEVDTSKPGEYTITYQVTDSDGQSAQMQTKVTVLPKDAGAGQKTVQRRLYTLPFADHLTDIGFHRGYGHDRQSLGFWLPADTPLKVRLVNYEEFLAGNEKADRKAEIRLKLLNNDAQTEKLMGDGMAEPADSVAIPQNGEWVTVKNCFKEQDGEGKLGSEDSVPFLYTPKGNTTQPIIEIEWNDAFSSIPYYRHHGDEDAFFAKWDREKSPYAIIEGDAATFLAPIKDRDQIIDHPGVKEAYQFHTIDEMLEWSAAFVKQYDAYAGLDFHAKQPYNQNVRAKFFIKANKSGAGLAYYSGDHSAFNGDNLGSYLCRDWTSLHEFGHGYEGAIATRENSFVETTNNLMGVYFEPTYRPEEDFGWLLDCEGSTKLERYNYLGRRSEEARNSVSSFNDLTEGQKEYRLTLFMFTNLTDHIGPERTVSAMHTQYRKYYYENKRHTSSSDVVIDSFSHAGGHNVAPYFDGWHIRPSEVLEERLYDEDLPMLYYLRNLVSSDSEAEALRKKLVANGVQMNGIYSPVSTDDLAGLNLGDGFASNVTLTLSIDDITPIEGRNILIKNGSKIAAEVPVTGKELSVKLPVGIYEVELPTPRTMDYRYGNEYLVAAKGAVEKELAYQKVAGNPLADDTQIRLLGMSDVEIAVLTQNTADGKVNCRINNVEPHIYFDGEDYVGIRILSPDGTELFRQRLQGAGKAEAVNRDFDFPLGSKVEVFHREIDRMRFVSQYTKEALLGYAVSGVDTVTYVMTDKGLMQEDWDEKEQMNAYQSALHAYSDYMMRNMSLSDLTLQGKFHNAKLVSAMAYEFLDDGAKEAYRKAYGALMGEEAGPVTGYHKVDSSKLAGTADSQQDTGENAAKNAVDGDEGTIWHSRWSGDGPKADIENGKNNSYTITLPENLNIGKLEYVPRPGNDNGVITSYALSYSTKESGDSFTDIPLASNEWAADKTVKSVEFSAPNARRIRIKALSTLGAAQNEYISAAEFYLYEAYSVSKQNAYLSSLHTDSPVKKYGEGDGVFLCVNGAGKEYFSGVGMEAGKEASWSLEGKGVDAFTAMIGVDFDRTQKDQARVEIYGDGTLLWQSGTLMGKDSAEAVYLDVSEVKELKIAAVGLSGNAFVALADAKLIGSQDKKEVFLYRGEAIPVLSNASLTPVDNGKVTWASSNPSVASVDGNGVVTAIGLGEAEITAAYAKEAKEPLVCKVTVRRTPAQVQEEIVKPLKLKAVAELNGYKKPADYRDAQKKQLALAIAAGVAAIEKAQDENGVAEALKAAKAAIDKIKTGAQLDKEEGGAVTYPTVGTKKTVGGVTYQIRASSASSRTAAVVASKKKAKAAIRPTVKIGGFAYQVTEIGAKAFCNNKKLAQVTVGANVIKIRKRAFEGCVNLKKVAIQSKKLTKIEKKAFSKIHPKAKITVPKAKKKKYKNLLKQSKIAGSVTVK